MRDRRGFVFPSERRRRSQFYVVVECETGRSQLRDALANPVSPTIQFLGLRLWREVLQLGDPLIESHIDTAHVRAEEIDDVNAFLGRIRLARI